MDYARRHRHARRARHRNLTLFHPLLWMKVAHPRLSPECCTVSDSSLVLGLKCRLCGKTYPKQALNFCPDDFGPLEVDYDYPAIARVFRKADLSSRPHTMWRYRELLPVDGTPTVGLHVGGTPLVKADRLARAIGHDGPLYVKNDAVNHPTLSFKDRVVAVALSKAVELGFDTVGCASTGNLAGSVAANAAAAGLEAYILIPDGLEQGKVIGCTVYGAKVIAIEGNYDHVNRLCSQIAFKYGWGFVNVNLRPFYAEGSKSMGFEIAEDLGWRAPDSIVAPMAGGSLIGKLHKAFKELEKLDFIPAARTRMFGAQATGCNPITNTVKTAASKVKPVRNPNTIAKSLAIGDPADGFFAAKLMSETGGWGEDVTDDEILDAMTQLAETEGIFTETAGGVTVAVARKLIEQGRLDSDGTTVLCITGNGLKTQEALAGHLARPIVIRPTIEEFEALVGTPAGEVLAAV
jgi:threonine synthase